MKSERAFLIGANGKLAGAWTKTLHDLNYEVVGFGVEQNIDQNLQHQIAKYFHTDLSTTTVETLVAYFTEFNPGAVVVNSGIDSLPGRGKESVEKYSLQEWEEIFSVNLFGVIKVLNAALITYAPVKRIVVIGSMYSEKSPVPYFYSHYGAAGQAKHPAYSASKAALLAAVRQYSVHFIARDTTLNMLSPGAILGSQDKEFVEKISSRIPAGRMGSMSELAEGLRFLLSSENSYYVGQNLTLDGGYGVW